MNYLPLASNLEDPIVQALESSEWLIVICSPRLKESLWCKKEIETFIALRGREHVLAVLVEGEPEESFPEELLYRTTKRTNADGSEEEVRIPVEPLEADVRGKNKKEMLKAMKTEILRLMAAMFELPYDDLRQRYRERKMRRIVTASLIGGAACLLFGVYSTITALRIQHQKEQIEAQSEQIKAQSEDIIQKSQEILQKNEEITLQNQEILQQNEELALKQASSLAEKATNYLEEGNRASAIQTAVEALTDAEGKYLAVKQWMGSSIIYDGETLAELGTAPDYADIVWGKGPFLATEGVLADFYPMYSENGQEEYVLYFVDMNTMQEISSYPFGNKVPECVQMQDGIAYVMSAFYSEDYGDCNTYTSAIEISTGNLLWEYEQKGRWPQLINLPVNQGATDLIVPAFFVKMVVCW